MYILVSGTNVNTDKVWSVGSELTTRLAYIAVWICASRPARNNGTDLYREYKPSPLAAMFFDESKRLEQSCNRITKETFLQNYIETGPVVSDEKIFKVFYIDI